MNTTIIKVSQLIFCQQELIAKPGNAVKAESDLNIQILKFLDDIKRSDRLVKKFKIRRFEQYKKQIDRVFLDIYITPNVCY